MKVLVLLLPLPPGEGWGKGVLQDYPGPLRALFLHDILFSAPQQDPLTSTLSRRERET